MTVNIAYGNATDGYLISSNATYTTARSGSNLFVSSLTDTLAYYGQMKEGTNYICYQAFISWNYTLTANEAVVSAHARLYNSGSWTTSVTRSMEIREFNWGPALTTADWRATGTTGTSDHIGVVDNVEDVPGGSYMSFGDDSLLTRLSTGASPLYGFVFSKRWHDANVPTGIEYNNFRAADESGTAYDPALVWTSVNDNTLVQVTGAAAMLSDGQTVYLEASAGGATPTITLKRHDGTTASTIATLTVDATNFRSVRSPQNYTLCVDRTRDHIYVIGSSGASQGSIAIKGYFKTGTNTWAAGTLRASALPTVAGSFTNNVSAAWHGTGGTLGTIMVVAARGAGTGAMTQTNDINYQLVSCDYLNNASGSLVRGQGSARGTLVPAANNADAAVAYANQTGSLLDVAAVGTADVLRGYVISARPAEELGGFNPSSHFRYVLASGGASIASSLDMSGFGTAWYTKNAQAKMRTLAISETVSAVITADEDTSYGLTVSIRQNSGTSSSVTNLGYVLLDDEGITSMPTAASLSVSSAWDALYDPDANTIWVYYFDKANPLRLMRTSIDMNTYVATQSQIQVSAAVGAVGSTNHVIRVPRGRITGRKVLVAIANTTSGGVDSTQYVVDTLNLAPTAPTLTARTNFDAAGSAVFAWTFQDPNAGDTQSAYQLQIVNTATQVTAFDSGKTASVTPSRTLTGGTIANGADYQWRVKTWDAADAEGAWSGYGTFATSNSGNVTITSPATDNDPKIFTDDWPIVWSAVGTTQSAYRVRLYNNGTNVQISDSGWVTSTATTYNITGMQTDVEYRVDVRVRNASLVESSSGTRLITPRYGQPETPVLSVTPVLEGGYMLVSVDNPEPGSVDIGTNAFEFDAAITNFNVVGGTFAYSTDFARRGTGSGKMTTVGVVTQMYARPNNTIVVPVVPGQRYTVRFWAYSVAGYPDIAAAIDWLDAGKQYLSTNAAGAALPAAAWTERSYTATAPAGAAYATFGPSIGTNPPNGTVVYIDDLILVAANDIPAIVLNQIMRREYGSTGSYTLIATVGENGQYQDFDAASGVAYEYVARGVTA